MVDKDTIDDPTLAPEATAESIGRLGYDRKDPNSPSFGANRETWQGYDHIPQPTSPGAQRSYEDGGGVPTEKPLSSEIEREVEGHRHAERPLWKTMTDRLKALFSSR